VTNLIEKTLLIGFGVFLLIGFLILISPFFEKIEMIGEENEDTNIYLDFIKEIDYAILKVIQNPKQDYLKNIKYPPNLNITFNNNFVRFDFFLKGEMYHKIIEYEQTFYTKFYYNFPPNEYLLNVSFQNSLIQVNFNK